MTFTVIPSTMLLAPSLPREKLSNEDRWLERIEAARLRSADNAVIHRIAGITYTEFQLSEQVTECFERSSKLTAKDIQTAMEYAALQSQTGNPDSAIEELSQLKDAPDACIDMHYALGNAQMQKGDIDQVIVIFQTRLTRFRKATRLPTLLAQAQDREGDFVTSESNACHSPANRDIRLALHAPEQITNRDGTGYLNLQTARIAFEVEDGARAGLYAAEAAEKMKTPNAYLVWIAVLPGQQKNQAAISTLTTAKALFPNDPRFQQLP